MGEVYRARDPRLDREVAVKVLPEAFARDAERLARFDREARALAALNHPGIAAIYGLEESDDTRFLVLELVPGETLAKKLFRGPLPVREALGLCAQIAEALAAAHEKGILHRDIKPSNVHVTPEGKVKLLDFGLARTQDRRTVDSTVTGSPADAATRPGQILGTAAYMSPEQARGKPLDKRTDIWAFGCVLYEALTGRQAFAAETTSDTVTAVLSEEPDWTALPAATPALVYSLLRRCLRKDMARRLHDIADAEIELEEALAALPGTAPLSGVAVDSPSPQGRRRRVGWLSISPLAVIVASTAGGLAWWMARQPAEPPSVTRFTLQLPAGRTVSRSGTLGGALAFSPDGTHVVYVGTETGRDMLYVRAIDRLKATPLSGTVGARRPFFSPDGQWVGFYGYSGERALKKVPLSGGTPIRLCDAGEFWGGSWGEGGSIVFARSRYRGLMRVSAEGGTPEALLPARPGLRFSWPQFLPGGKAVLFTLFELEKPPARIAVLSLDTREYRLLVEGHYARYANGLLVYAQGDSLFAAPFDIERLELTGAPVPALEGVRFREASEFSLSRDGSLVYLPGAGRAERALLRVGRDGRIDRLTEAERDYVQPRFSPDGTRIAVLARGEGNWIFDTRRNQMTRLLGAAGESPVWSPDGTRLVFSECREEGCGLFSTPADGSGASERICPPTPMDALGGSWAAESNILVFEQDHSGDQADIYVLPMDGRQEPRPWATTPSVLELAPRLSPDGRWVAYEARRGREAPGVFVASFPTGDGKWQVSSEGMSPVWGPDGRELFYRSGRKLMVVSIEAEPGFVVGEPRRILEDDSITWNSGSWGVANYDVSPDGQTFVMVSEEAPLTQINVVLNWSEELKRLDPGN
jgi:serine/threonine-protein kinase